MKKWILRAGIALWLMCSVYTLSVSFLPGPQGEKGIQGPQGLRGDSGIMRIQGLKGPQGIQGLQGPQGIQGVQGEKGNTGATGLWGLRGPQGLQGERGYSVDLPKLYKRTSPAVVWIGAEVDPEDYWEYQYKMGTDIKWQGTGFLVTPCLIATAGHMIEYTKTFVVQFQDGSRAKADFVYMENLGYCDVGFIQLQEEYRIERSYLEFDTDVEAGESAIILGYPWGMNETISITSGIVAASKHKAYYTKLSLYADIASYPGNSGSPVLDMDGKVIGILVAGPYENECYSMCTPTWIVKLAMQKALAEIGLRECP